MKRNLRPDADPVEQASRVLCVGSGPSGSNAEAVEGAGAEYERTKNPVHAWRALAICLGDAVPIPEWLRLYLLECSLRFLDLQTGPVPRRDEIAPAVARAVGLQGGGRRNPFVEIWRPAHDIQIAFRVYRHQTAHRDLKWFSIFDDVAREHSQSSLTCVVCARGRISAKSVERIWRARALDVIPRHLVAKANSQNIDDILRQ